MDQVHKKRIETIRRRKEEEALLGTSGITKPLGPVGTPKHANKSSASPNRIPRLLGLTTSPAHHARKRTVVSEQLARLFEDRPMATESASLVPLPRPRSDFKKPESTRRTVWSTSSDFEMSETSPPPGRHGSSNHSNDGQASEKPNDEDDNEKATKDSPFPLELAAPDRPYTKWKGECSQVYEPNRALLTRSRCQRVSKIDSRRAYSRRICVIHNHSEVSVDLPDSIVPQGIRRACPARWSLCCRLTTMIGVCAPQLILDSERTEGRVYMTTKTGPFRCVRRPFFVAELNKDQPKSKRLLLFPEAPPTPPNHPR